MHTGNSLAREKGRSPVLADVLIGWERGVKRKGRRYRESQARPPDPAWSVLHNTFSKMCLSYVWIGFKYVLCTNVNPDVCGCVSSKVNQADNSQENDYININANHPYPF